MKSLSLLLMAFFIQGSLFAQDPQPVPDSEFEVWDVDDDEKIERHEFITKFADKYFERWEPSDPAGLIEEGFLRQSFAGLDTDSDNMLSDEEWLIGYNYFYDEYVEFEGVGPMDVDGDGMVSFNEYQDVLYDTEYFTMIDLDKDNFISEYELANYVFNNWDMNKSGIISKSEFNKFNWYYLDV